MIRRRRLVARASKISSQLDRCVGGKKDFQLESDTLDSCCFYVIRENNVITRNRKLQGIAVCAHFLRFARKSPTPWRRSRRSKCTHHRSVASRRAYTDTRANRGAPRRDLDAKIDDDTWKLGAGWLYECPAVAVVSRVATSTRI